MPLSDPKVRNAKPGEKQFKLSDTDGMYLLVDKCQDIGYPSLMLKSVTTSVTRYADLYKIS